VTSFFFLIAGVGSTNPASAVNITANPGSPQTVGTPVTFTGLPVEDRASTSTSSGLRTRQELTHWCVSPPQTRAGSGIQREFWPAPTWSPYRLGA